MSDESNSYIVKETKRCFDEHGCLHVKIETLLGGKCYQSAITRRYRNMSIFGGDAPNGKRYSIDVKDSRR